MKSDIINAADIKLLLDTFYNKLLKDEQIGYFFTDVAQIHLAEHMPILYSFWETLLFGTAGYQGNPILKHIELHKKSPITDAHFVQWKKIFFETIDELFEGNLANLAKEKANAMHLLMMYKIEASENKNFIQ